MEVNEALSAEAGLNTKCRKSQSATGDITMLKYLYMNILDSLSIGSIR